MTAPSFSIPESVDLQSAVPLAEALSQYIAAHANPVVNTARLRQGGLSLLQILVAGCRLAETMGKTLVVEASPDGPVTRLFETFGLEPALSGVVAGPDAGSKTASTQGN